MRKVRYIFAVLLSLCMLAGVFVLPNTFVAAEDNIGIFVGNSAHRADYDPQPDNVDYWNDFYVSGGESLYWLWKTTNASPAIFRYDLPDNATAFEPYFDGEKNVQDFAIYA
jgi:hypothetical protein